MPQVDIIALRRTTAPHTSSSPAQGADLGPADDQGGSAWLAVHGERTGVLLHEPAFASTVERGNARAVRVVVTTLPDAVGKLGQQDLVQAAPEAVARPAGDAAHAGRTPVVFVEAAEGDRQSPG